MIEAALLHPHSEFSKTLRQFLVTFDECSNLRENKIFYYILLVHASCPHLYSRGKVLNKLNRFPNQQLSFDLSFPIMHNQIRCMKKIIKKKIYGTFWYLAHV
jgi:hypothetical protein